MKITSAGFSDELPDVISHVWEKLQHKSHKSFQDDSQNSAPWNMYTRLPFSNNHPNFIFKKEKKLHNLSYFSWFLQLLPIFHMTNSQDRDTFHNTGS